MFLTEISESDILTIYDRVKFKCRTFIESINLLFTMGSELEQEVDTIETSVGTSDDEASSSGSLWARVKYALANMVKTSGAQTIADVKTFTSSPKVPNTPATVDSAVNQAYVESTVDGVNNLVHKSGAEQITGLKTFKTGIETDIVRCNALFNINGQTKALYKIDTILDQAHSVAFTMVSRNGVYNVRFVVNSASTALSGCDITSTGDDFLTHKLVVAVDNTPESPGIYIGVNNPTLNSIVAISNIVCYRGGTMVHEFAQSNVDISTMSIIPIEVVQ